MDIQKFIAKHGLSQDYVEVAKKWFFPLFDQIMSSPDLKQETLVIGINGSQGSGKSTLSDLMVSVGREDFGLEVVALSIDDFYLTREERSSFAEKVHPLLLTRGVPGTHDIDLSISTLLGLKNFTKPLSIPRFDKSEDDRFHRQQAAIRQRILNLPGYRPPK